MRKRQFILSLLAAPLAACSFRPLYGTSPSGVSVADELQSISIKEVRSRPAQLVRNNLLSAMRGDGAANRYTLVLDISGNESGVSVLGDRRTNRYRYRLNGSYRLIANASGNVVNSGSSFSVVPFDTVREPIADIQAQRAAMERAALELAQDIRVRLAAFLATQKV